MNATAWEKKQGFTLVELLVVIAIISMLAALLLPALENTLLTARISACSSQMRQLYIGMTLYADSWDGAVAKEDRGPFGDNRMGWAGSSAQLFYSPYQPSTLEERRHFLVVNHGAWMANALCDPALYFCPGMTYETKAWGFTFTERKAIYTGKWRPFLESGGMSGAYDNDVGYFYNGSTVTLNLMVTPGTQWSGNPMDAKLRGMTLDKLTEGFPLLADTRALLVGGVSCHAGSGWNVVYGSGAVLFRSTPSVIGTGIRDNVNFWGNSYSLSWAGVQRTPDNPYDDPDRPLNRFFMRTGDWMKTWQQCNQYSMVWNVFYLMGTE